MTVVDAMFPEWNEDKIMRVRQEQLMSHETDRLWLEDGYDAVLAILRMRPEFTTDDVWALLGARRVSPPSTPRAMGAIALRVTKQAACVKTDRLCFGRTVFRSLLYGTPQVATKAKQ